MGKRLRRVLPPILSLTLSSVAWPAWGQFGRAASARAGARATPVPGLSGRAAASATLAAPGGVSPSLRSILPRARGPVGTAPPAAVYAPAAAAARALHSAPALAAREPAPSNHAAAATVSPTPTAAAARPERLPRGDPATPRGAAREENGSAPNAGPRDDGRDSAEESYLPEDSARGKTVLLVGTKRTREFVLAEAVRTARALGFQLYLVDAPEHRVHSEGLIPDSRFIAAPITDRDPEAVEAAAQAVARHPAAAKADVVAGFFSSYANITARITDLVGAAGIPGSAVAAADDKTATRRVLNAVPELAVPSRPVASAEEARRAFAELGGGKFIMKTIRGENSRFLTVGIDTPEKAAEAFVQMDAAVRAFSARPESRTTTFSHHPGIMIERMLEKVPGSEETSVEVVMQRGRPAFALVSDTLNIGPRNELAAGSITFPSEQPNAIREAITAAASRALAVIGITNGNARVDMILTKDGPKVVEINPFMGAVAIFTAIRSLTGVSLVEQGLRALLGLRVAGGAAPDGVVDYRFLASRHTGVVESVEGFDELRKAEGVIHAELSVEPGGRVTAAGANSYEEYGEIIVKSRSFPEALEKSLSALRRLALRVRTAAGTTESMPGDYAQPGSSPGVARERRPRPALFSKVVFGFLSTFILVSTVVESTSLAVSQMTAPLTQGFMALTALTTVSYAAYTLGSFLGGRWVDRFGIARSYRLVLAFRTALWTVMAALFFSFGTVPLWALVPLFSLDYFAHSIGRVAEHKLQVAWFHDSPSESSRFGSFRDFIEYGTVFVASAMGLAIAAAGFGAVLYPAPAAFALAALISLALKLPGASAGPARRADWTAGFRSVFANAGIWKPLAGTMLLNSFLYMLYYIVATAFGAYVAGEPTAAAAVAGSLTGLYGVGALLGALSMDRLSVSQEKATARLPEGERAAAQRALYDASAARSLRWAALALPGSWAFVSQVPLFTFGWPFFAVSPVLVAVGFTAQRALIHLDTIMKDRIPSADTSLAGGILGAIRSLTYLSHVAGFLLWGSLFALLGTGAFAAFAAFYTAAAAAYLWLARSLPSRGDQAAGRETASASDTPSRGDPALSRGIARAPWGPGPTPRGGASGERPRAEENGSAPRR